MATYVPPKKNTELIFYMDLVSQTNGKIFQVNPTLAAGDVLVSTDGGATSNLDTLPTVTPAGGTSIKVTVSATEMNGDSIKLTFHDATGAEWCDAATTISTSAQTLDGIRQILTGKWEIVNNQLIMYDTDGSTALYTFDLTRDGTPSEFNPDLRSPV